MYFFHNNYIQRKTVRRTHRTGQRSWIISVVQSSRITSPRSWRMTWKHWSNHSMWIRFPKLWRALFSSY